MKKIMFLKVFVVLLGWVIFANAQEIQWTKYYTTKKGHNYFFYTPEFYQQERICAAKRDWENCKIIANIAQKECEKFADSSNYACSKLISVGDILYKKHKEKALELLGIACVKQPYQSKCRYYRDREIEIYAMECKSQNKECKKAFELASQACQERGEFCSIVATLYEEGKGVFRNYKKAIELREKLCKQGNKDECIKLAECYQQGKGVAKNEIKAFEIYRYLCKQGNEETCYRAGKMLIADQINDNEQFSKMDAKVLFGIGCDGGLEKACVEYKKLNEAKILTFDELNNKCKSGDAQSCKKAILIEQELCIKGDDQSCFKVGLEYYKGEKIKQDFLAAYEFFNKVCDKNSGKENLSACTILGVMFVRGEGVKQNFQKAKEYFDLSCQQREGMGCLNLGRLYEEGKGVQRDIKKSLEYYAIACQQNHFLACTIYAEKLEKGEGIEKNPSSAATLYLQSCDNGILPACHNLGLMYYNGNGVRQDLQKSIQLLEYACQQGWAHSCNKMGSFYTEEMKLEKAENFYKRGCDLGDESSCETYWKIQAKEL
ncbi:tetratricopeptide repeat protein [Helicobacter pullorum]|uniref:tetratricopeptide repeat protein n=2 Tax=Helicobacter pullorum TaxID=35818 RepID=UPI0017483296|nr:tetratricopeptide repeat protein [Helicobacter pullorum]